MKIPEPADDPRPTPPDASTGLQRPGRPIAVMPAYNAGLTLRQTVSDIPAGSVDEIILVDDCSRDNTVPVARELGLTVIRHEKNLGYGGNQKTCYRRALQSGADYVVMIHPDYQYDSRVIPLAVEIIRLGICDVVLGSRIRTRREALDGGMPLYKYVANRGLTVVENVLLGQNLGDFHSGFRAYRREVLETIPFERNSDDFVFDSQFLAQAVHFGFKLGDIPVPVRYFKEASSINFRRSTRYGLTTLGVVAKFWAHRLGIKRSPLFEKSEPSQEQVFAAQSRQHGDSEQPSAATQVEVHHGDTETQREQ
jgi:glycosyltransferase involved in cell wall biosynthesis